MKRSNMKAIGALAGAAAVLVGATQVDLPVMTQEAPAPAPSKEDVELAGNLISRDTESYETISNVKGTFCFTQEVVTPADDVFNLFGTAATAMCAKPGFAFNEVETENYYVNLRGSIKKSKSISLKDLKKEEATTKVMACSCATSAALANAKVKGVRVADILELNDLEAGVNTITFRDDEGYGIPMPLDYVLEKDAMLVWQIGDAELPESAPLQVWMPDTVAKYFTRRVMEIELTAENETPAIVNADDAYRAKINVINRVSFDTFAVGDQITFEGYADDCGSAIAAIEFSLDGGNTWTVCETSEADSERWVYWTFSYVTEKVGTYKLDVQARTEEGLVSPLGASVVFTVE